MKKTLEEQLTELEALAIKLASPDTDIETSITLYQKAAQVSKDIKKQLLLIDTKIEKVTSDLKE